MKHWKFALGAIALAGLATAYAQQPEGPGSGDSGGPPRPPRPPQPIVDALDADHDGAISAEELKNASESLSKLDKNGDGKLTDEEFRPRGPRPGPDDDRGRPEGRERGRDGGIRDHRPNGPPGSARGERRPEGPRESGPPGDGPRGGGQRGEGDRPPGRRPPRPDGPDGPPGGPGGPPGDPDRMFDHAMEYDADSDGKLSQEELKKFIADFVEHQPRRPGPDGPGGPDGPEGRGPGGRGDGPPRGGPRERPGSSDRERPERPRRPE